MLKDLIAEISETVESAKVQAGTSATGEVSVFVMIVHESECEEQF